MNPQLSAAPQTFLDVLLDDPSKSWEQEYPLLAEIEVGKPATATPEPKPKRKAPKPPVSDGSYRKKKQDLADVMDYLNRNRAMETPPAPAPVAPPVALIEPEVRKVVRCCTCGDGSCRVGPFVERYV